MANSDPMLRLWRYMRPFSGRLSFSIVSGILNKIADLMPPLLVGWVIDSVAGNAPHWIRVLAHSNSPWHLAVFLSVLAVVIFAVESLFQWMYQYGFMTLAQQVQHSLRMDVYAHLQRREISFFENHRLGNTLSIVNDDINQLERFLYNGFVELLHLGVLILFSGYVMAITSWQLAAIGLVPLPFIIWGSLRYQKVIRPFYLRVRQAAGELSNRLENNLSGILVIKSFTAEKFEQGRVADASNAYQTENQRVITRSALYVPLIRMLVAVGFAGVLLVGSYWILSGTTALTVGQLVLFSMLIQRVLWPLTRLGNVLDDYERAGASAKRVFDLLDTEPQIQSPLQPVTKTEIKGDIDLRNVEFNYRRDIPILNGLSLSVKAGETIGIAGTTGAGKSTLVKLLLRLYDPVSGFVAFDGTDIRDLPLNQVRGAVALVSQDVYLFHGTIYDNIAYGTSNCIDGDVYHAAKSAELHDFILSLPDGYNTIVGERGIKLSGGQRQRLSIARAILKNAPIMIFDEATSSVDTETERAIQQNLYKITAGKTALIIAHRISTIRHADRIVVLDGGKVVEEGDHETLLKVGGRYADLWNVQIGNVTGP